ncbi:MAG: hypothetical protein FD165_1987 [Gammaproteobacteria bacterium]|nr:MAG: hypothetical protein FD165_1987 [Gammaproteobacteria bacterium]TND04979.1 MAG: hypothetical protein FD120_1257 [Gammaproteobacteria bacterium]
MNKKPGAAAISGRRVASTWRDIRHLMANLQTANSRLASWTAGRQVSAYFYLYRCRHSGQASNASSSRNPARIGAVALPDCIGPSQPEGLDSSAAVPDVALGPCSRQDSTSPVHGLVLSKEEPSSRAKRSGDPGSSPAECIEPKKQQWTRRMQTAPAAVLCLSPTPAPDPAHNPDSLLP